MSSKKNSPAMSHKQFPAMDTRIDMSEVGANVNGKEIYYGGSKATMMMSRQFLTIEREGLVLTSVSLRHVILVSTSDSNATGDREARKSVTISFIKISEVWTCLPYACTTVANAPEALQLNFDCLDADAVASDIRIAARIPDRLNSSTSSSQRSFAAILNPVSGNSISSQILREIIFPILSQASIDLTTYSTNAKGDAEKFARELKLDKNGNEFEGIIALGGDGTATEVHSGNMRNLRLPFAIIPVGSDNSLSFTIGIRNVVEALLAIIKGPVIAIDVLSLHELPAGSTTIEGDAVIYPMCSIAFGVMADALLDIERTRWMGKIRSPLVVMKRVLYDGFLKVGPRRYGWTVKYRPSPSPFSTCKIPYRESCKVCEAEANPPEKLQPWSKVPFNDFAHVTIGTHPGKTMSIPNAKLYPPAHWADGRAELYTVKGMWLGNFLPHLIGTSKGHVYYDDPNVRYQKCSEILIECSQEPDQGPGSDFWVVGIDGEVYRPKTASIGVKINHRAAQMYTYRDFWGEVSNKGLLSSLFSSTPNSEIKTL